MFATPKGAQSIDLDYMEVLATRGFDVDLTQSLDEVTGERLQRYNAVVLFESPDAFTLTSGVPLTVEHDEAFKHVIDNYVSSEGGVLLMPEETHWVKQRLGVLTDAWGARIPAEQIVEEAEDRRGLLPRGNYQVPLAYTESIVPSPITRGIRGVWYPTGNATLPIVLDEEWEVLVRASPTAHTARTVVSATQAPPTLVQRDVPEKAPAIFAVRQVGAGRVALIAQWPQFSFVSGTKWIFDRVVLERGLRDVPSDFGHLLENTLRWLSEPSVCSGRLGGVHSNQGPFAPNAAPDVLASYKAEPAPYDLSALHDASLPAGQRVYRGIIGARTNLSTGRGDVAEYARTARQAGLDFIVFLEPLEALTQDELLVLAQQCVAHSGPDLLLLPGFSVVNNIGNRMMFYGPHPAYPPDIFLTGPKKSILYVQEKNAAGLFTGYNTPYLDWILGTYHGGQGQVGYFDFGGAPKGMKLHDARLYSVAGVRYYRNGRLLEDVLEDYLLTAAGTIPPTPVTVHEVDSPKALRQQARARMGLTYVVASSLSVEAKDGLYQKGLRWKHQFEAMSTFVSSGPEIIAWPGCFRATTYGAEGFSAERSLMFAPVALESTVGLRNFEIYDGPKLFRHVELHGTKSYRGTFVLDGALQRNLVLVVRDLAGGTAVSFARRSWSEGASSPVFCADHINDCVQMLLAHGPWSLRMSDPPLLPEYRAGITWDGGPKATVSAIGRQNVMAEGGLKSGRFSSFRLNPIPILEFSDEGAVGVTAWRRDAFDDTLLNVVNPWNTLGPLSDKRSFFENVQHYRQWLATSDGAPPYGWAAMGTRNGMNASLFTSRIRFSRPTRVEELSLASFQRVADAVMAVFPREGEAMTIDVAQPEVADVSLGVGDAVAFFGKRAMNAHVFVNRANSVRVHFGAAVEVNAEGLPHDFAAGHGYVFEVAGFAFPIEPPVRSLDDIAPLIRYLRDSRSLDIVRGARTSSPGLIDLLPAEGGVELKASKTPFNGILPARVLGLNARWSAGLLLIKGYLAGFYGPAENRYRALAVSADGTAHFPLDAARSETHVVAGHPIVADAAGRDLFIQVTCLGGTPPRWHISVNNPETHPVRTRLRKAMALPGLSFSEMTVSLRPGELLVLQ